METSTPALTSLELSYLKDPRKLSRRQARWSLFLQDFDIVWKVLPGAKLAPTDALSRYSQVDTSLDNDNTPIVPEPAVINALDLTLARHIQSSSSTDPLVLRAIQNLSDDTPLFPRSSLADWTFDNGHLYYKCRMYSGSKKCPNVCMFFTKVDNP